MNDLKTTSKQIHEALEHVSDLENYLKEGISTGFNEIDHLTGKMRKGQIWTIGGSSGIGKSYFILNLINRISKYKKLNVMIFAVEMNTTEYFIRLACMREGIYKNQLHNNYKHYQQAIEKQLLDIHKDFPEDNRIFEVHGDISSYEQIDKLTDNKSIDLIIVDYVQALSVQGKYNEADTMPILPLKLQELKRKTGAVIIAVSQLNLSASKTDYDTTNASPMSYGKVLKQVSDVELILDRQKSEGSFHSNLIVQLVKARDGMLGRTAYSIVDGYRLEDIKDLSEKKLIIESYAKAKRT